MLRYFLVTFSAIWILLSSATASAAENLRFAFDPLKNPATFDGGVPDPAAYYVNGRPRNYYDDRALRRGEISGTISVRRPGARLDTKTRAWQVSRQKIAGAEVVVLEAADFSIALHGAVTAEKDVRRLLVRAFGKRVFYGER